MSTGKHLCGGVFVWAYQQPCMKSRAGTAAGFFLSILHASMRSDLSWETRRQPIQSFA